MGCGCGGGQKLQSSQIARGGGVNITSQATLAAQNNGQGQRIVASKGVSLGTQPVRSNVVRKQV